MNEPSEHTEADLAIHDFLLALTLPAQTPSVPQEIRERAAYLLGRYPGAWCPKSIYKSCGDSLNTQNESENNTSAYDEATWQSMGWVERLLKDPQRIRDTVANVGLVLGVFLVIAIMVTNYFLR